MSNCLLNVVAQHLRFYYTVAESVKNSRDVEAGDKLSFSLRQTSVYLAALPL